MAKWRVRHSAIALLWFLREYIFKQQILFAKYQEQVLTAMALEKMGVAQKIQSPDSDNLKEAIVFLPKLFNKAQIWAQKLSKWNRDYLSDAVRSCLVKL
jgi:hypothetical protein